MEIPIPFIPNVFLRWLAQPSVKSAIFGMIVIGIFYGLRRRATPFLLTLLICGFVFSMSSAISFLPGVSFKLSMDNGEVLPRALVSMPYYCHQMSGANYGAGSYHKKEVWKVTDLSGIVVFEPKIVVGIPISCSPKLVHKPKNSKYGVNLDIVHPLAWSTRRFIGLDELGTKKTEFNLESVKAVLDSTSKIEGEILMPNVYPAYSSVFELGIDSVFQCADRIETCMRIENFLKTNGKRILRGEAAAFKKRISYERLCKC